MAKTTRHRDAPYWVHSNPDDPASTAAAGQAPTVEQLRHIAMHVACPGDCNRAWRRATDKALFELEAHPDSPNPDRLNHGVPMAERAPHWCRTCQDQLTAVIAGLPELALKCRSIGGDSGRLAPAPPSEIRTARVAAASPSPAFDMVDEIAQWAVVAADQLCARLSGEIRLTHLTTAVGYLVGHATALWSTPYAVDLGRDLQHLVKRAELAAGADKLVHPLTDVECPRCDRRALERADGSEIVRCRACRAQWDWDHYRRLSVHYREQVKGTS